MRAGHRKFLVETSIEFFIKELGLDRSRYTLTVIQDPTLAQEENCQGLVFRIGPQDLAMVLYSRLKGQDLVETIAHEMVHVKQLARGTLNSVTSRGRTQHFWRGKKVKEMAYHRRPWEVEAFQLERLLANNFVYDMLGKIK